MKRRHVKLGLGGIGLTVVAVLGLMVTATLTTGGFDSTTEELIRGLNMQLTFIAVPITILVEALLVYTAVRYRNNDDPKPTKEHRWLEISWTVATALILVLVGVLSYQVMAQPAVTATPEQMAESPDGTADVVIVGHQWYWEVRYPDANVTLNNAKTIYLPADEQLTIAVESADVIHSIHIPGLAIKQDAIPGQRSYVQTTITSTGEYQLYCAEFCGVAHSKMTAKVKVVNQSAYQQWLEDKRQSEE